jgi:hypothetical protein
MEGKLWYSSIELLEIVTKNRKKHADEYAKARKGYQAKLVKALTEELKNAKQGKKVVFHHINLARPKKHLADYDRAIMQLKMATDSAVEMTNEDFAQLIMDEWSWKKEFSASNAFYSGKTVDDTDEDD